MREMADFKKETKRQPFRAIAFIAIIATFTIVSAWWGNLVREDMVQIIRERNLPTNHPER
jgi:hypothetical protein